MASRGKAPPAAFTTNEHDQREAEKLQARLRNNSNTSNIRRRLTHVRIADGAHKYVQIRASLDGGDPEYFVTSRRGASYHRDAAEPFIKDLEANGYHDIEITGGGRILVDEDAKKISVFGYSYSFGQPNHDISRDVIHSDPRFKSFDITTSNEGY